MTTPNCPECGQPLQEVLFPGGYLNEDQWASIRAGDWFCANHGEIRPRYFWNRELWQRQPESPPQASEKASPLDIDAIRKRCEAATPEPWRRIVGRVGDGGAVSQEEQLCNAHGVAALIILHDASEEGTANAEFIAHARTDLPAALDRIADIERERDEALQAHPVMQDDIASALRALGLADSARPASPHRVMVEEVIPAIAFFRSRLAAANERIGAMLMVVGAARDGAEHHDEDCDCSLHEALDSLSQPTEDAGT